MTQIFVSIDTETHLITDEDPIPKLVIVSIAMLDKNGVIQGRLLRHDLPGMSPKIFRRTLLGMFANKNIHWVNANIAYDMQVLTREIPELLPLIFDAYSENRVCDVLINESLYAIANGTLGMFPDGRPLGGNRDRYSLETVARWHLKIEAKENDDYRLRYKELDDVPFTDWPEVAKQYPIDDAVNTLACHFAQETAARAHPTGGNWEHRYDQARAAYALELGATIGWRINSDRVEGVRKKFESQRENPGVLLDVGLLKYHEDKENWLTMDRPIVKRKMVEAYAEKPPSCGVCDGMAIIIEAKISEKTGKALKPKVSTCKACDGTGTYIDSIVGLPRSDKGAISYGRDSLLESGDELLIELAHFTEGDKILQTYLPKFEACARMGTGLRAKPNVIVSTTRVSYAGLLQTVPRSAGLRQCVQARDGKSIYSSDYSGIEMAGFAQACLDLLGYSKLAEAINGGVDSHSLFAATMGNVSYEHFLANKKEKKFSALRQAAKAANFGFPGGMNELKLTISKRSEDYITTSKAGNSYKGIRFCILIGDHDTCGERKDKIYEYKGKPCEPVCGNCVRYAKVLRDNWFRQWPEAKEYLERMSAESKGTDLVQSRASGLYRGGTTYTSRANFHFQERVAFGAKRALWHVQRECHVDKASPLYGTTKVLVFAHDELLGEVSNDPTLFRPAMKRIREIMKREMFAAIPNVLVDAEPALMHFWDKGADPVYNDQGELEVWLPKNN